MRSPTGTRTAVAHSFPWLDFVLVVVLGVIATNFLLEASLRSAAVAPLFAGALRGRATIAAAIAAVAGLLWAIASRTSRLTARLVVAPLGLLAFWPADAAAQPLWVPVAVVAATALLFARMLTRAPQAERGRCGAVVAIAAIDFAVFTAIGLWNLEHLQMFNPKDWAVYNQSFWTTIHGHFFVNSIYTSYFAGHTTWFFFLLVPLYYLFPDPRTLLVVKVLLLSLSVIPFYLIAKDVLRAEPPLTLLAAFLLFPFIVTQNLNAPHEMGYAPFFLLWTYWFYRKERFGPFVLLLLLTLSIKEHLSAVAVAFGCYAWCQQKSRRWVAVPMALGAAVGLFSVWFIAHMQVLYHDPGNSSWVMMSFKRRFAAAHGSVPWRVLNAATVTSRNGLEAIALLVVPLGVVPPFLGGAWLLGAPEIALNIVIDRPAVFSPIWHYNVAASCMLIVSSVAGIGRIADALALRYAGLTPARMRALGAGALCALVLVHSYTWLGYATGHRPLLDVGALRRAIASVPRDGYLTAPERVLPLVSGRSRLSLLEDGTLGDFVLVDTADLAERTAATLDARYRETFREDGIRVFSRVR